MFSLLQYLQNNRHKKTKLPEEIIKTNKKTIILQNTSYDFAEKNKKLFF